VVITDALDPRLTFNGASLGGSYNSANRIVSWLIPNLNVGETLNLTFNITINGPSIISNIANVTTDKVNIGNNSSNNLTISVRPYVNLTITKTASTPNPSYEQEITYTITVTKHGPDTANNVTVTDILDPRLILIGTYPGVSYNILNRTLIWTIGSLGVGENTNLTFTVIINGTGNITNIANVTTDEVNVGNDSTNVTVTVPSTVNLTITKSMSLPGNLAVGKEVVYTITVTNNCPDNGTNVVVTDVLDPRLIYVSDNNGTNIIHTNGTIIWNIGDLANGQTVILNITVRINGTGNINNFANVSVDEINIDNNSTDVNVTVASAVNLTVTKTASVSEIVNGHTITYTIVVTNHLPDDATNVIAIEILEIN